MRGDSIERGYERLFEGLEVTDRLKRKKRQQENTKRFNLTIYAPEIYKHHRKLETLQKGLSEFAAKHLRLDQADSKEWGQLRTVEYVEAYWSVLSPFTFRIARPEA